MNRDTHHTNSESFQSHSNSISNSNSNSSSYQSQQICQNQHQKKLLPSNSLDLVVSLVRTDVEKRPSYFHVRLIPSKPDRIPIYPTQHIDSTYIRTDTTSIHGYIPQSIQHTQNSTFLESGPGSVPMISYSQENNAIGMSTNKRTLLPLNSSEENYSTEHSLRYSQEFSQNVPQNIPQNVYQERYIGTHNENDSISHQNNINYSIQHGINVPHYVQQDRMYRGETRESHQGQKIMSNEKKYRKELNKSSSRASDKAGRLERESSDNDNAKNSLSTGYLFDPSMNLWTSTRYASPANVFETSGIPGIPGKANSWNSLAESWVTSGEDAGPHNNTSPLPANNNDNFRNLNGPQSVIGQSYLDDSDSRTKSKNTDTHSNTQKREGSSSGSRRGGNDNDNGDGSSACERQSEGHGMCDNSHALANTDTNTDRKKNILRDESTSHKNKAMNIPRNSSQEHPAEHSSNPGPSSRNRKTSDSSLREYFRFSEDNGGDKEEGSYLCLEGRALEPSTDADADIDVDTDVAVLADSGGAEQRENRDSVNGNSDENENENENGSDSRSVAREYASANTSSGYNYDNFFDDLMDVATSADIEGYYDPRPV